MDNAKPTYDDLLKENYLLKKKLGITENDESDLKKKSKEFDFTIEQQVFNFQKVIDGLPIAIFSYKKDGNTISINKKFTSLFGYTLKDLPDLKTLFNKIFTEDEYRANIEGKWNEALQQFNNSATFHPFELEVTCKEGSQRIVELGYEGFSNAHLVSFIDITNYIKAENKLKQSEEKFRILVENAPEAIVVFDFEKGKFVEANDNACQLFKYSKEELLQLGPIDLSPPTQPNGQTSAASAIEKILLAISGKPQQFEWTHRNALGEDIPCEIHLSNLPSATSVLIRGSIVDISERKKTIQAIKESEEKFALAFKNAPVFIGITNLQDGTIMDVNEFALNDSGYSREEVIGNTSVGIGWIALEDRNILVSAVQKEGRINGLEIPYRRKNGEIIQGLVFGELMELNKTKCLLTVTLDISQKREAEKAIKESEEKFSIAFKNAPILISITNLNDGTYIDVNDFALTISGFSREEIVGHKSTEIGWISTENRKTLLDAMQEKGRIDGIELPFRKKNGDIVYGLVYGELIKLKNEQCLLTVTLDVTEKRDTQLALKESEERFRALIEHAPDAVFLHDFNGRIIDVNERAINELGYSREELTSKTIMEIDVAYPKLQFLQRVWEKLKKENTLLIQGNHKRKDGNIIPVEIHLSTYYKYNEWFFIAYVHDISARKLTESLIKESQERLKLLSEGTFEGVIISKDGKIIDANEQLSTIYQYSISEIKEYGIKKLVHPEDLELVLSNMNNNSPGPYEHKGIRKDGSVLYLEIRATNILLGNEKHRMTILRDITNRKMIELELENHKNHLSELVKERTEELEAANEELTSMNEELFSTNDELEHQKDELKEAINKLRETQLQLVQAEKMASLGILTAGVAHEINNPLNYIQAGIYSISNVLGSKKETENPNLIPDIVSKMQIGVDRVSNIVKSLNHFSRNNNNMKQNCNIHNVINNCLIILTHELKDKCTVQRDFFLEDFSILADEGKLHQIFINVLSNSVQAIENKGAISIQTSLTVNKENVQIVISDTGKGIKPEHLDKVFDPFFTTKDPGKGTGLGLSIVYQIIKEHKGSIKYESEINKGTVVTILLPIK